MWVSLKRRNRPFHLFPRTLLKKNPSLIVDFLARVCTCVYVCTWYIYFSIVSVMCICPPLPYFRTFLFHPPLSWKGHPVCISIYCIIKVRVCVLVLIFCHVVKIPSFSSFIRKQNNKTLQRSPNLTQFVCLLAFLLSPSSPSSFKSHLSLGEKRQFSIF